MIGLVGHVAKCGGKLLNWIVQFISTIYSSAAVQFLATEVIHISFLLWCFLLLPERYEILHWDGTAKATADIAANSLVTYCRNKLLPRRPFRFWNHLKAGKNTEKRIFKKSAPFVFFLRIVSFWIFFEHAARQGWSEHERDRNVDTCPRKSFLCMKKHYNNWASTDEVYCLEESSSKLTQRNSKLQ